MCAQTQLTTSTSATRVLVSSHLPSWTPCAKPVSTKPPTIANPFAIPPRFFVTCPTHIPPNADANTGIRVRTSQPRNKTVGSSAMRPACDTSRAGIATNAISSVKTWAGVPMRCMAYWHAAEAMPERELATITAATPTASSASDDDDLPLDDDPPSPPPSWSITPATSNPASATICTTLCLVPNRRYRHSAVDTSFDWLRQLKVMLSMLWYPNTSR